MPIISAISALHDRIFTSLESGLNGWFLGLAARLVFTGVLLLYYLNSFATKVGEGFTGFFVVQDGAYYQILPSVIEAYEYDTANIPFIPYDLIVIAGTYTEVLLPIMIVIGLFTRIAALGMIGFIIVQSYVDIVFHGVEEKTIGALFDRFPDSLILDQRSLWIFLLAYLVIKGAGAISLDGILSARRRPSD